MTNLYMVLLFFSIFYQLHQVYQISDPRTIPKSPWLEFLPVESPIGVSTKLTPIGLSTGRIWNSTRLDFLPWHYILEYWMIISDNISYLYSFFTITNSHFAHNPRQALHDQFVQVDQVSLESCAWQYKAYYHLWVNEKVYYYLCWFCQISWINKFFLKMFMRQRMENIDDIKPSIWLCIMCYWTNNSVIHNFYI